MKVTVLYFASLREAVGKDRETVDLPNEVKTVRAMRDWLAMRGGDWQTLSAGRVRAAINQTLALPDAGIAAGDEIAFFPPVTGG